MAERNWRDEVEPLTARGSEVLHCEWCAYSGKWVCLVRDSSDGEILQGGPIMLKAKSPTYRPYKRGELKCGDVLVSKYSGAQVLVTGIMPAENKASINGWCGHGTGWVTFRFLFENHTKLDGTPAGMPDIS